MVGLRFRIYHIENKIKMAIAVMILKTFWSMTTVLPYNGLIDNSLAGIASLIFIISIIEKKYPIKTLLIYSVITLLALYSSLQIGHVGFLVTIIICFAIRKENIDEIVKYMYQLNIYFLAIAAILSIVLHILGARSIISVISGEMRYNFGFSHPNTFSTMLLNVILMWIYINFDRMKFKNIGIIMILSTIVYFFTKTRTFIITVPIIAVILCYIKICRRKSVKVMSILAYGLTPFFAFLTYIMAVLYKNDNAIALLADQVLSSRIKLVAYGLTNFGISFWGQNLSNIKVIYDTYWRLNSFTFDNIYSYFIINIGTLWLIIISLLFAFLAKKRNVKINLCIVVWALFGLTEVHGINCYQFFPLMLCATLLDGEGRRHD